ncbi:MAG: hypothetical protein ACI4UX_03005 [Clostridia bacterium]
MNKKVIIGIVAVVVIAVIVGIVLMTKGGSNSKIETETLTWNELKFYKVSIDVPKDKGYELIKGKSEKAPYNWDAKFTLVSERFIIEFNDTSYVYQTSDAWKEKYGETEANFEDFKKATTEKINGMTGTVKQINGEDVVVKYVSKNSKYIGMTRCYNTDGMRTDGKNFQFSATIYVLDESIDDIDALLEEEEVKTIFDSIKIEKK